MPIYEYWCEKCQCITEYYFHLAADVPQELFCYECEGPVRKLLSTFNTGSLFKKLSGVDDTDELTLGKIIADGKIPDEYARPMRQKREKYKRNLIAYEKRKAQHKFGETD